MMKRYSFYFLFGLLLCGCDNSLDPLNENKGIYSIFGYLDINSDTNYVRIKNLNVPNIKDSAGTINGTVTLTNLESGVMTVLHDTTIVFDGVITHNFVIARDILPLTTYRIKAVRKDGRSTLAKATTPNATNFTVSSPKTPPVCTTPITVRFQPVHPETFIYVVINFFFQGRKYRFSKALRPSPGYGGGFSFTFQPHGFLKKQVCGRNPKCLSNFPDLPPGACYLMIKPYFYLNYYHYGPNIDFAIDDSLVIPGGVGTFIGVGLGSKDIYIKNKKIRP